MLSPFAASTGTTITWLLGLLVSAAFVAVGVRHYREDLEALSVIAVVATVLASPHLLIYDTFILLIPAAVAHRRGLLTGDRAGVLAAIHVVSIAFGPAIYLLQADRLGRGISLEMPALLACTWLIHHWNRRSELESEPAVVSETVLAGS